MLTRKQHRFVEEYLCDLNATQAAIRAGYSARTAAQIGDENLRKPQIAIEVQRRMLDRQQRTEVTQDMVIAELAKIAFANIGDVLGCDAAGAWANQIAPSTMAAVASYEETIALKDGEPVAIRRHIRLHDKLGALIALARHLGMTGDPQRRRDDDPIGRILAQAQGTYLRPVSRPFE